MKKRTRHRWLILSGVVCALVLTGSVTASQAQRINRKRPGVYLTFKQFVKKTASEAYPSQGARLVLHNNTRWPIYYGRWYETTLPSDVAVIYNIEQRGGCPELRRHVEVISNVKLLPGKSVSFTVPREDFPKGSSLYVIFYYSWELNQDNANPNMAEHTHPDEAEHRAYFHSFKLPVWPQ